MSRSCRQTERRRTRRRRERLGAARQQAVDRCRGFAAQGSTLGWYVNHSWRDTGQALVTALRRTPDAHLGDAWGRLDIDAGEVSRSTREKRPA